MALSLLKTLSQKGTVRVSSRKSTVKTSLRKYSYDAHHAPKEVGVIEKRILQARVLFPSSIGTSVMHPEATTGSIIEELKNTPILTPQEEQSTFVENVRSLISAFLPHIFPTF
jgi:hypothetical protein